MKASLRVITLLVAAAFGLAPAAAFAQAAPEPLAANTPPRDTIGPSELQNFNLNGRVTRPADQPPAPASTPPAQTTVRPATPAPRRVVQNSPVQQAAPVAASAVTSPAPAPAAPPQVTTRETPATSATVALPPLQGTAAAVPAPNAPITSDAAPVVNEPLVPWRNLPLWPWLAAAFAAVGGAAFLLWRRRPREALAGAPLFDLLVPPAPEPQLRRASPQPTPRPPAAAPPKSAPAGFVASRLRPALEIAFQPLRCQVDDDQVTIEFELELFNAGAAPARAVLAEASLLNASATQDQDLAAFFANPQGIGERLDVIPPMKRVSFKNQVVAPRAAIQEYELAGRKAFVPVIAFNALYEWSGGRAQSSAAYLIGRDTQREKLGPLRLDQGAREYRGLGARPLPSALRT
jgi:hypothetical protein